MGNLEERHFNESRGMKSLFLLGRGSFLGQDRQPDRIRSSLPQVFSHEMWKSAESGFPVKSPQFSVIPSTSALSQGRWPHLSGTGSWHLGVGSSLEEGLTDAVPESQL